MYLNKFNILNVLKNNLYLLSLNVTFQLTNSTEWMIDAREGIKGKCLAEVRVNATLQNNTNDDGISIADIVRNISCINDCLGRGKCLNGRLAYNG